MHNFQQVGRNRYEIAEGKRRCLFVDVSEGQTRSQLVIRDCGLVQWYNAGDIETGLNAARVASVHPRLSENAHNVVDGNDCASRQRVDGLVQVGFERPVNGDVKRLNFVGGVGRQREQDHVVCFAKSIIS